MILRESIPGIPIEYARLSRRFKTARARVAEWLGNVEMAIDGGECSGMERLWKCEHALRGIAPSGGENGVATPADANAAIEMTATLFAKQAVIKGRR